MAKKRVHEIAKERGLTSAALLAILKQAGIEAKAAQSSVEEADALKALDGSGNGASAKAPASKAAAKKAPAKKPAAKKAPAKKPAAKKAPAKAEAKPAAKKAPAKAGAPKAPAAPPAAERQAAAKAAAPPAAAPPAEGDGTQGAESKPAARPTRGSLQGERAPGASGGRRRRVVIDSQASRTQPPPQPHRPPRRGRGRRRSPGPIEEPIAKQVAEREATKINSGATVKDVSEALGVQVADLMKQLMSMGEMATITQTLTDEAIEVLADALDKKVEIVHAADEVEPEREFTDEAAALRDRPPVVTIMGHVDHGKTSLLDAIRQTEVAAGEAGGITQHIGAYQVHHDHKTVTFLDTPGHEAFTAMRARGAKVTDIAVIVVAADDGVMPQTTEAIDHAKAAEVPMLIAVNKIDKEGADPNRVRTELAAQGLNPEEWGGETVYCDVSAKTKEGLDNLLDMIALVAEVEELKANPDAEASGVVVESRLDPGRGPVVTVLVQRGTLEVGDAVLSGAHWGRVRAMHDFRGERTKQAVPGQPAEVLGFDSVPDAGETMRVVENERRARQLAGERATRLKTEHLARRQQGVSLEDVFARIQTGAVKEINLIIKSDVTGSLEAIEDELAKVPQDQVQLQVIHTGVGGVNESDVMLAAASEAIIIGFNVRPLLEARQLAERENVEIRTYTVIYKITEELRAAMEGMLEPEQVEQSVGTVEVRQTFRASKIGTIAGCYVTDGKITRNAKVRLVRDGTIVWEGNLASLKRFKDDAREVAEGFECGIVLDGFQDVKEGDVIEAFEIREVERAL